MDELECLFPSMKGKIIRDWKTIIYSSCALQVWVRKLIDGKCMNNEMHGILCHDNLEPMNSDEERMVLYLTYGPTSRRFDFKHFGQPEQEEGITAEIKTTRSGRKIKEPSKKYVEWDGKSIKRGSSEALMDCDEGNSAD